MTRQPNTTRRPARGTRAPARPTGKTAATAVFAVFVAVAAAAAGAADLAQEGAPLASLVVPPARIARHSSSHRAARMLGGEGEFVDDQHGPGGAGQNDDDPHRKGEVIPFVVGKDADSSQTLNEYSCCTRLNA